MSRCKLFALAVYFIGSAAAHAQELFVYSEPASNMATNTLGIRATNWLMNEGGAGRVNYHFIPELMFGVSKRVMFHAEGFFSNRANGSFAPEGGGIYAKYRFYASDAVNRHFRMAAFGRIAGNNAPVQQQEIDINGHNSGYAIGVIATQLLHKTALSATVYHQHALSGAAELPPGYAAGATSYSLSAGRLLLPRVYTSYRQTNMNLMVEVLGEVLTGTGRQYVDIAPSLQLIFNSQTRLDIGYRLQLYSAMSRTAPTGLLLRVEHLLYRVLLASA